MSGDLSPGAIGEVAWTDGHWVTGWARHDDAAPSQPWCVARFAPTGDLERAPVCNVVPSRMAGDAVPVRLAAGAGGLALVGQVETDLLFLRTDGIGTVVGSPIAVTTDGGPAGLSGSYAVAWGSNAFAVLYAHGGDPASLWLRMFVSGS